MVKIRRDVDEVDDWFETLIKGEGFPDTDDYYEAVINAILDRMKSYREGKVPGYDELDAELMEDELRTAIIAMVHRGATALTVPYRHIRHALDVPVSLDVYRRKNEWVVFEKSTGIKAEARAAIKGPLRGIRAKCMECQGGSMDLIRSCPSVNCFLWAFRMANNPFYGRLVASADNDDNEDAFEGEAEMAAADEEFEREEAERIARMKNNGNKG